MSYAPDTLTAARQLFLNLIPGMDRLSLGVVGDDSHKASGSSYHLGKDALRADSYSIVESPRDRGGLTNAASALDVGMFRVTVAGKTWTLRDLSLWLVAQCKAGTADTVDIREIIYSPDGRVVKRWDRLAKRSTGDNSHLEHTHISWFRDSEKRDKTALFTRWFTEIGLLEDTDMPSAEEIARAVWSYDVDPGDATQSGFGALLTLLARTNATTNKQLPALLAAISGIPEALLTELAESTRTAQDQAAALRALLGDERAVEVGRILAA